MSRRFKILELLPWSFHNFAWNQKVVCSYFENKLQWIRINNSNIWNLIPGCLMWIVWLERNRRSFENIEKTLDELKVLCQRSLFKWARCQGFTDSSSLLEFMFSLRLSFLISLFCFVVWFYCFLLFIIMNYLYFSFFLIYNSSLITYPKKKKIQISVCRIIMDKDKDLDQCLQLLLLLNITMNFSYINVLIDLRKLIFIHVLGIIVFGWVVKGGNWIVHTNCKYPLIGEKYILILLFPSK